MTGDLSASGLLGKDTMSQLVRHGHFAYESGHHGDAWLVLELLFADPKRLEHAAAQLAARLHRFDAELVCAPLIGGALLGQWVARELGVGFVYAERHPPTAGGPTRYAIPQALHAAASGKRALIVDDAINAGSAVLACAREVESLVGRVVAVASLIARDSAPPEMVRRLGVPTESLVTLRWNMWAAMDCPLCRNGVPLNPAP